MTRTELLKKILVEKSEAQRQLGLAINRGRPYEAQEYKAQLKRLDAVEDAINSLTSLE